MVELTNTAPAVREQTTEKHPSFNRLLALDIVRGYAMLLMLISHSSWWLADLNYGVAYGLDNQIVPVLSLPESIPGFVLQLATPAFFLLGGFSIALFTASRYRRGWTEWQITRFLLIRGVLLIALDLLVMNLRFDPPYYGNYTSVLTGIGICVCSMALLRRLDWRMLAIVMVLLLFGTQMYYHELISAGNFPQEESLLRAVLLMPTTIDVTWRSQFPALPWLPVVMLGFLAGSQVVVRGASLARLAVKLGVGCLAIFAAVFIAADFGNLYPADPFIFGKTPPDLAYISLYVGITFLLIALHTKIESLHTTLFMKMLIVLGQTALFFYIIHIRLIELVSPVFAPLPLPPLERSMLIVAVVLAMLLVLCLLYRSYKRQHPESLLKYL